MTKPIISVIALDARAGQSYKTDILALFGEVAEVRVYACNDGTASGELPPADLFVISTDAFSVLEQLSCHIPSGSQSMSIQSSFKWSDLQRLQEIPAQSEVLFVNMTRTMAREAIAQLEQFGITHVHWTPFYPGATLTEPVSIAVTPDEMRYVPEGIETVIDVGQRVCTSGMMIEIALRLEVEYLIKTPPFVEYFSSVATNNYNFDTMFARSFRLESQFYSLMDTLDNGVIGISEQGTIFACNHNAEAIIQRKAQEVIGLSCAEICPFIPFEECLSTQKKVPVKVIEVKSTPLNLEVVPVIREGEFMGAFAILQCFQDVEDRQSKLRRDLYHKGHYAKYDFDHVIGNSPIIEQTKTVLTRMAQSKSPILLIGETGTGKEIFAHAVHRASPRKDGPFVAINVAAVPENLLESQLFGYEEGAFTGARKGGCPGLFEFSHRGTLFLDEVEGMSQALQVKLLRALQEREVMRVGGNRIIQIDVRILSATNESLEDKVEDGSFRRDLYYRLSTLPALIPPLTQREDDLLLIMEHFKRELGGEFTLSHEVNHFFHGYHWPGNIRELHNVVEYLIYTGQSEIQLEHLPTTMRKDQSRPAKPQTKATALEGTEHTKTFWFVLEQLFQASQNRTPIGRDTIIQAAYEVYLPLSQLEVRNLLKEMSEMGLVRVSRGRGGSQLTPEGRNYWLNGQR